MKDILELIAVVRLLRNFELGLGLMRCASLRQTSAAGLASLIEFVVARAQKE